MFDLDALSRPLDDDQPAGPNLEYDNEFLALESAARGKPEQQFGDTIVPAEAPDWKTVGRLCVTLLERTRDLRVAALLVRAACHTEGIAGFARGLELLSRLTCELWAHVHPQLDPDDGNDPFMRLSALSLLADGEGMQRGEGLLRDLRGTEIVAVRGMGTCRMRDAELTLELLDGVEETPQFSRGQLQAMLAAAAQAGEPDHAGLALASLTRLLDFLRDTLGSVDTPDAGLLLERLKALTSLRAQALGGSDTDEAAAMQANEADSAAQEPSAGGGPAMRAGSAHSTDIRHRDDALALLTRVCDYLERHEPTNPAPLLIRRAQRLMTMSFVEIMREMAPEGMDSLTKIAGADQMPSADDGY